MKIKHAALVLSLWAMHATAEIHVIQQLEEILGFIDDNTLVVMDIDNTMIEALNPLASDQGFYYLLRRFQEHDGLCFEKANDRAVSLWNQMQSLAKTKAVEAQTPHLMAGLQVPTMALTARDPAIKDITREQLLNNGINFAKNAPLQDDMTMLVGGTTALYTGGILFQGEGSNKGIVLVEFLRRLNLMPTIIFVDDREKNVYQVNEALSALPIKHYEFRYAATDERVKAFNEASMHADFLLDTLFGSELVSIIDNPPLADS